MPVTEAMTAFDPNRSITELKSGRSTPACCGREVLRSLECVGQAAAHRGLSLARRPVSASKSAIWPWSFNRQPGSGAPSPRQQEHGVVEPRGRVIEPSAPASAQELMHALREPYRYRVYEYESFPPMRGQLCLVRPKNVPVRLAGVCSGLEM